MFWISKQYVTFHCGQKFLSIFNVIFIHRESPCFVRLMFMPWQTVQQTDLPGLHFVFVFCNFWFVAYERIRECIISSKIT
jgi:hypothetical protein